MSKFELEYPITRGFTRWPHFTLIVLAASAISLAGLTLLNVRLVGFETVTSLQGDFNTTQPSWLDRLSPVKEQNLCQPVVLNMGDSFVTNSSMFLWDLELVSKANQSSSGLIYKGSTLENCDVIAIYLNAQMNPPTLDVVAVVSCRDLDGFDVIGKTSFPFSVLPGTYSRFMGKLAGFSNLERILPYNLIQLGALDLLTHIEAMMATETPFPDIFSAEVSYTPCPAMLGPTAPCATTPPPVDITSSVVIMLNGTSSYHTGGLNSSALVQSDLFAPLTNIIQMIHAAVQIDLGIAHQNNLLLNPSVLNDTLFSAFPAAVLAKPTVSNLYQVISTGNFVMIPTLLPMRVSGPAKLEVRYLCRLQQMKAPAQAFIAVLVATLSMFSSGWGLFMLIATYWAKRGRKLANSCAVHDIELGVKESLLQNPQ